MLLPVINILSVSSEYLQLTVCYAVENRSGKTGITASNCSLREPMNRLLIGFSQASRVWSRANRVSREQSCDEGDRMGTWTYSIDAAVS